MSADIPTSRNRVVRALHRTASGTSVISDPVTVTVAPVLAATAPRRVAAGRALPVRGEVRPRKAAVLVEAARVAADGRAGRTARVRVRVRDGRFRALVRLRPGLYRLRARFAGDRTNRASRSADLYARVVRRASAARAARAGR
jgi:hypothetical protein